MTHLRQRRVLRKRAAPSMASPSLFTGIHALLLRPSHCAAPRASYLATLRFALARRRRHPCRRLGRLRSPGFAALRWLRPSFFGSKPTNFRQTSLFPGGLSRRPSVIAVPSASFSQSTVVSAEEHQIGDASNAAGSEPTPSDVSANEIQWAVKLQPPISKTQTRSWLRRLCDSITRATVVRAAFRRSIRSQTSPIS